MGVIGLGSIGRKHLYNSLQLKNARLLAVADVSEKSRSLAREVGVKKVYSDYERLLENPIIDCVIISLPTFLHAKCAKKASELGKHIFIEKPLARNVKEGKEIVSAIKRNNLRGMIGYPMRFVSQFVELKKKINSGVLGDIVTAYATNVHSGPFTHRVEGSVPSPVPSWWFNPELTGGGALLDLGSHQINLLRWYFGDEVDSVTTVLGRRFNMDFEDSALCILNFRRGPKVAMNVGWFFSYGHVTSIELFGTSSRAVASVRASTDVLKRGLAMLRQRAYRETFPYYYYELRYFVDCIQKDLPPLPSLEDGLKDLEMISLAYKNAVTL